MAFNRNLHVTLPDGESDGHTVASFGPQLDESLIENLQVIGEGGKPQKHPNGTPMTVQRKMLKAEDEAMVPALKKIIAAGIEALGGKAFVHAAAGVGLERGDAGEHLKGKTIRTVQVTFTTYTDD